MEITKEGLEKLRKELEGLKTVKRQEITDRLRKAIAFGDLSENFDYANAKEEQEMTERKIAELEDVIAGSTVVSISQNIETVRLGRTVSLENNGEKFSFTITDPQLANPVEGKISAESPIGEALLGKKQDDIVEVQTPNGKTKYKILKIS